MIQHQSPVEARDVVHVLHPYTNAVIHHAEGPLVIGIDAMLDRAARGLDGTAAWVSVLSGSAGHA